MFLFNYSVHTFNFCLHNINTNLKGNELVRIPRYVNTDDYRMFTVFENTDVYLQQMVQRLGQHSHP